jgi:hypothetical protein
MKNRLESRIGAGIAGGILLAISAIGFFVAGAPQGAGIVIALTGIAMLIAGIAGLCLD